MTERTPRNGRALALASAVFGASWLGWRVIDSFHGAPLWLALSALAVELVGFVAFGLLVWALWPDRRVAGAVDHPAAAPEMTVVVRCGQRSLDAVRGTVLAARSLGPVVLLDDAPRARVDLADMASADGLGLHRTAEDEVVDPLVSVARWATTEGLVLLDAGQVPAPDLVVRLLPWFEPDVAVVQGAVRTVDGARPVERRAPFAQVLAVGLGARGVAMVQGGGAVLRRSAIASLDDATVPAGAAEVMARQHLTIGLFAAGWRIAAPGEVVVAAPTSLVAPSIEAVGVPGDPVTAERSRADEACAARLAVSAALSRHPGVPLTIAQRGALSATAVLPLAGIRRSVLALVLVGCLLEGSLPFQPTPGPLLGLWLPWFVLSAVALWRMSDGALRPGDRSREATARLGTSWRGVTAPNGAPVTSRSALGMLFGLDHGAAVVTMVVFLSVVIGLRGLSDRVTHTLHPMTVADTVLLLVASLWVLAAGLSMLRLLTVRALPRRTTRVTTSLTSTFAGTPALVADITPRGAAVIGSLQVEEGDRGDLELVLPTATGCVSARIDVVVRYVRSGRGVDLGGERRAGVEFVALPAHVRDALIEFCMVQPGLAALAGTASTPTPEFVTPLTVDAERSPTPRRAGLRIAVVVALVGAVASSLTPSADASAGVSVAVTGSTVGDAVAVLPLATAASLDARPPDAGTEPVGAAATTGPVVAVVCAVEPGGDDLYGTSDDLVTAPRSAVADGAGRFSLDLAPEAGTRLDGGRVAVSAGTACWRSVTPAAASSTGALALRDTVWHDRDLNGSFDNGEQPVAEAMVTLLRADDPAAPVAVARVRTDWAGRFEFTALPAGDYQVALSDLPNGLLTADVLGRSAVFHLSPGAEASVPGLALVDASARFASGGATTGGPVRWLPAVRGAELAPDRGLEQPAVRWLVPLMTLLLATPLLLGLVTVPAWTRRRRGGGHDGTPQPDREPLRLPISLDRRPRHLWR